MTDIGTLNPEQMLQQQQILRQQKMAEMLMQQGMQQPQGQMVSGHYVRPSIFQNLAGLANVYMGQKGIEKGDQAQIDLANAIRQGDIAATTDFMATKQGRPEIAGTPDIPTETYETVRGTPAQAAIPANPQRAYADLYKDPRASGRLQNMAFNKMFADPEAFTLSEGASRFMTMPDGSTKQIAVGAQKPPSLTEDVKNYQFLKDSNQLPKGMTLLGYQSYLKQVSRDATEKAPMGYRFMTDGSLEPIKGGPADLKTQAKMAGAGDVSTEIVKLKDSYDKLYAGGGITDPSLKIGSNLAGKASSSDLGQSIGSTFGTKNATERDKISQTRPLLMGAIMKATGMSAKQIDSNAELKLWLSTATDPKKSYEANIEALNNLENLYGVTALEKQSPTPINLNLPAANTSKKIAKEGTVQDGPNKGKRAIQYTDGTIEYK